MFLEYIKLLGTGTQPEFSFDYMLPAALILLCVVAVVFIGYTSLNVPAGDPALPGEQGPLDIVAPGYSRNGQVD